MAEADPHEGLNKEWVISQDLTTGFEKESDQISQNYLLEQNQPKKSSSQHLENLGLMGSKGLHRDPQEKTRLSPDPTIKNSNESDQNSQNLLFSQIQREKSSSQHLENWGPTGEKGPHRGGDDQNTKDSGEAALQEEKERDQNPYNSQKNN